MNITKNSLASLRRLARGTRGANMVEYIILVGIVALLAVVGFKTFSKNVSDTIVGQGTVITGVKSNGSGAMNGSQ